MRILSMTATFGKLEHQTLTLQPGLNIVEAPNEWGKSTWCDFLLAMLYGIDTRERTTKAALAQKERYDPWSGSPMSGSLRLVWQGRDITVERSTRGRVPMGEFRAYETQSGLELPQLTADNCGQMLLGVEKSVFVRSGFVKFDSLSVSTDPDLSRRLNALVTTGDDSGTAEIMSEKLRELKNKIRANKAKGLIPQALEQKAELEARLREWETLSGGIAQCQQREAQLAEYQEALLLHKKQLDYDAARDNVQRVETARRAAETAAGELQRLEQRCAGLPELETAQLHLRSLKQMQEEALALQLEQQLLPPVPELPTETGAFGGLSREQIECMLVADTAAYAKTAKSNGWMAALGAVAAVAGLAVGILLHPAGYLLTAVGLLCIVAAMVMNRNHKRAVAKLLEKYGNSPPENWKKMADDHLLRRERAQEDRERSKKVEDDLLSRQRALSERLPEEGLQNAMDRWQDVISARDALDDARKNARQAQSHAEALSAMQTAPEKPEGEDSMTFTADETARLLGDNTYQREQLHRQLGVFQGRMEALGQLEPMQQALSAVNGRLDRLEQTYAAVVLAQETLEAAQRQLRSRFAPRIAQRAGDAMARLTDGRYDRLSLTSELSVNVAAQNEDVQREGFRRSDGTVDQLYLSLRLAVAGELIPDAPLILDDALVRFDDTRLQAALQLLQEEAQQRQILLFTCQGRENALLAGQ